MKKIIVTAAILTALIPASYAGASHRDKTTVRNERRQRREERPLEDQEVNYQALQQFYIDFGTLPISYARRTPAFDEITFTRDGQELKAYYDNDAQLIGTSSTKDFTDLPFNAQQYIRKRYSDYEAGPVMFFDDNETNDADIVLYGTQVTDDDMYFVELTKGAKHIVLKVEMDGNVSFFTQMG